VDTVVKAGESASDPVALNWDWQEGAVYTITELQCRRGVAFEKLGGNSNNAYRFVYDPMDDLQIICQNRMMEWQIRVVNQIKSGEGEIPLAGVIFGLYSPHPEDQLTEAGSIPLTMTKDGRVWYLTAFDTTDARGQLVFDGLLREDYYLQELQTPAGEHPTWLGGSITRKDATDGEYVQDVIHDPGVVLPETGGPGTEVFRVLGAVLLGIALMSGLVFLCRRKAR
jgi:hypothetical protein